MNDVKQRGSKTFISSREELIASDRPTLYSRRRTPAKIIRFFRKPGLRLCGRVSHVALSTATLLILSHSRPARAEAWLVSPARAG
jgi:hypothetical protein